MHRVFVASDGAGLTIERVLNAALTQFERAEVQVERRPEARTEEQWAGWSVIDVTDELQETASEILALVRQHNEL